jgi:enoyl-CoA hydratase/carnithine racemase
VSADLSVTGGISRLLPLLVGPVRAKGLLLLGDRFGAARAMELGLINRVSPAGQHERVAAELAARLHAQPALALAKQALDKGADCAQEEAMAAEVDFAALTVARAALTAQRSAMPADAASAGGLAAGPKARGRAAATPGPRTFVPAADAGQVVP